MAENQQRSGSSSSEEDDFCRISDGAQSDQGGDVQAQVEGDKQQTAEEGSVELSEFCQVVFQNVAESYKPGKPLECYYTLSPVLVPTTKDYVAVFKVGWNSIRHYVTFEYAPYPKNWKEGEEYKQCILFNYHHLPREEDGEFYQFCYIDSYGKMRGASTPFQFLLTSMDDFMEVADESIDFLMIQSKRSQNSELIAQLQGEKDALALEKAQIEKEKNQLVGKVEELESALSVKDEEVKEFTDKVKTLEETMAQIPVLEGKLADCEKQLADLEAEKKRYEESLQQTTEAFMEVQSNITQLEEERNRLKNELEPLVKERDEFKAQFASSEKDNETLRAEIDSLKHQLMEANQQNQVILAKEGALKEEKMKVEQQLLVASSDQDHKKSLESQVRDFQEKLAKSEEDYRKMEQQLKAMSDFHLKLKQDYEDSKIECDALKSKLLRQGEDFLQKQKRMERQLSLEKHNANEKRVLLETQVTALKEGIQKLAKDKESLAKGTIGSEEASHIAVKAFKDKMIAAKRKSEEEAHKRLQAQKELFELKATSEAETEDNKKIVEFYKTQLDEARENVEQLERDSSKEIDSLKVRLEMAKEEYKLLYKEVRGLESKKGGRKGSTASKGEVPSPEPVVEKEVAVVQSSPVAAPPPTKPLVPEQDSYDSRDMTLNMEQMTRQLCQLTGELKKRRAKMEEYKTLYEDERMRRKEAENLYQEMQESKRIKDEENMKKYRAKQEELTSWKEKYNRMHDDYLRTKHAFESYKFDTSLAKSPVKKTAPRPVESTAANVVEGIVPCPPPRLHYGNPYDGHDSLPLATPPGKYRNPYVGGDSRDLSGFQSIRNASNLPEPLAPQVLPQARHVAVKASIKDKQDGGGAVRMPTAPPLPSQEDEEDLYRAGINEEVNGVMFPRDIQSDGVNLGEVRSQSPTIYHDAPEYPLTPPDKSCPQCSMQFAHDVADDVLAAHMQSHFTYHCPECDTLMDRETYTDADFQRHCASHQSDQDLKHYCPFCQIILKDLTEEQVEQHVHKHIPN